MGWFTWILVTFSEFFQYSLLLQGSFPGFPAQKNRVPSVLITCVVLCYSACLWKEVVRKREKKYIWDTPTYSLWNTFPSFSFQPDDLPLEVLDANANSMAVRLEHVFKQTQEKGEKKNREKKKNHKASLHTPSLMGTFFPILCPEWQTSLAVLPTSFAIYLLYLGHWHLTGKPN